MKKVKRARDVPPISFETPKHQFFNYPSFFPNKVHMVNTNIKLSMELEFGLLLGLNFIPFLFINTNKSPQHLQSTLKLVKNSSFNML
jgi:hypothetical protein